MFKLLIVLIFILKIKTENENSFKIRNATGRISDRNRTNKPLSSISYRDRLYLDYSVTENNAFYSLGQRSKSKSDKMVEDRTKLKLRSRKLAKSRFRNLLERTNRQKIMQGRPWGDLNIQKQEGMLTKPFKSNLLTITSKTKPFENADQNDRLSNSTQNEIVNDFRTNDGSARGPDETVFEVPYNLLGDEFNERSSEEHHNTNYENLVISKYKPDAILDSRPECGTDVNKRNKSHRTPDIVFDSEQGDGDRTVSLIYTLITLRPRPHYDCTDNKPVKKEMEPDKCSKKTSAKCIFQTTPKTHHKEEKISRNDVNSNLGKNKHKLAHYTVETKSKDHKEPKHEKPAVTVQPWPDLTVKRDLCDTRPKVNSVLNHLSRHIQKPDILPVKNAALAENSFNVVPLHHMGSISQKGADNTFDESKPQVGQKGRTKCRFPMHLITADLGVEAKKHSTESLPTVGPESNNDNIKIPSTTLHTETSSQEGSNNSWKGPLETSPQFNISNALVGSNKTNITTDLKIEPTEPANLNQVIAVSNEVNSKVPTHPTPESTILDISSQVIQSTSESFNEKQSESTSTTEKTNITIRLKIGSTEPYNLNKVIVVTTEISPKSSTNLTQESTTGLVTTTTQINHLTQENLNQNQSENTTTTEQTNLETTIGLLMTYGQTQDSTSANLKQCESTHTTEPSNHVEEEDPMCKIILNPSTKSTLASDCNAAIAKEASDLIKKSKAVGNTKSYVVEETTNSVFPICPHGSSETVASKEITTVQTLSKETEPEPPDEDCEIMSFSRPPAAVFSHGVELIETLFNDGVRGVTCVDQPTTAEDVEPSRLEDLFPSQTAVTFVAKNENDSGKGRVQAKAVNEKSTPETTSSTDAQESILLGHIISMTTCDIESTFSKGPLKGHFSKSEENVSKCLADYSRLFSNLATKKCE